ncbi:MAG TPA: hypothetical protein VGH95_02810 [Candidatus Aquirickettsiella sp.]
MAILILNHSICIRQSLDKLTYCADNSCQRSGRKNDPITQKFSNKCLDQGVVYA